MCNLSPLAGLEVAEIYLSCGWVGGWVVGWVVGWLGGWVARQNGNNAKLSPKLKLKLVEAVLG